MLIRELLNEQEQTELKSLQSIFIKIAEIVGQSQDADTIAEALETYAEKYPQSYRLARKDTHLLNFLTALEEETNAQINL